jgi:hypothetical protein
MRESAQRDVISSESVRGDLRDVDPGDRAPACVESSCEDVDHG